MALASRHCARLLPVPGLGSPLHSIWTSPLRALHMPRNALPGAFPGLIPQVRSFSSSAPMAKSIVALNARKSLFNSVYRPCSAFAISALPTINNGSRVSVRSFHLSTPRLYDRLQSLEDAANRDRDNARTQASFLKVFYCFMEWLTMLGSVYQVSRVRCQTLREWTICCQRRVYPALSPSTYKTRTSYLQFS
jgi:hypothetical protein